MDRDQLTLLDHLAPLDLHLTDHPTHPLNKPTLSESTLLGRMSLLDRMNIKHCEINSRPSSLSIETRKCPSPELSQGLACSSTTMPPSPILKRKRPLTFMSKNSTLSTPDETPDSSCMLRFLYLILSRCYLIIIQTLFHFNAALTQPRASSITSFRHRA